MDINFIQISGRTKTAEGESISQTPYVIIGKGTDIQGETSADGNFIETLEGTTDVKSLTITFLPKGDFALKSFTNLVQTAIDTKTTVKDKDQELNIVDKKENISSDSKITITITLKNPLTGEVATGEATRTINRILNEGKARRAATSSAGLIAKSKLSPSENEITAIYSLGNITLLPLIPNIDKFQKDLQIKVQEVENLEIEVNNFRKLTFETKFAIVLNKAKESIKRTLFPFILGLLAEFGIKYLQAVLDRIPGAKPDTCPSPEKIKEIIRKRDQLVRQLNRFYKMITRASKILGIANTIIIAIKVGIIASKFIPLRFVPGAFVTGITKVEKRLEIAGIAVSILSVAAAIIGMVLAQIIELLNALDLSIQNCSIEQNIPMEELNDELNKLSSQVTKETELNDNSYKGFTFEIKEDPTNVNSYTKRFAQALNAQKVPVLKSESSFASNPQVLIDQLKFVIDTQDLKAD